MKRRSFLAALFAAPFFPASSAAFKDIEKSPANASDNKARLITEETARVDADSALASNIGTIQAGLLRSKDGRLAVDLSAGAILIRS